MGEILSFPGLGLQFQINRVAFMIGNMQIYWYGIIIAAAFLLGSAYILARCKTFGLDGDRLLDVLLGGVILGIVGARVYYVLFQWDTYGLNPVSILNIRNGGIAFYGGLIGGVLGGVIVCIWRKVRILPALDLGMCGMLIGQAVGRWGNFVNMEAFGSNTSLPWGMTSDSIYWYLRQNLNELGALGVNIDPTMPVHPTFFYESMWCVIGFLFLLWFTKRRRFDGQMTLIYLCWNGLGRFFIEGMRTDSLMLGTMRVSQILALLLVLACGVTLAAVTSKIKRANDPEYLKLYVDTDEGRAVVAGEFYKKKIVEPEESATEESATEEAETEPEVETDTEVEPETETEPELEVEPETAEPEAADEAASDKAGEEAREDGGNN